MNDLKISILSAIVGSVVTGIFALIIYYLGDNKPTNLGENKVVMEGNTYQARPNVVVVNSEGGLFSSVSANANNSTIITDNRVVAGKNSIVVGNGSNARINVNK